MGHSWALRILILVFIAIGIIIGIIVIGVIIIIGIIIIVIISFVCFRSIVFCSVLFRWDAGMGGMKRGAETPIDVLEGSCGSRVGGSDSTAAGVASRVARGRQSAGDCQQQEASWFVSEPDGDLEMPVVVDRHENKDRRCIDSWWAGRCMRCGQLSAYPWREVPETCTGRCPICKLPPGIWR